MAALAVLALSLSAVTSLVAAAPASSTPASPAALERLRTSTLESLEPQEHVLRDGSRAGSLVYVDSHGDLVRVRYHAGPSAGPRGFHLEEVPVEIPIGGPLGGRGPARGPRKSRSPPDSGPQGSGRALQVRLPPREVRRAPTPRPSDVFWQPKEAADVARKERSDRMPPAAARVRGIARVKKLPSATRTRDAPPPDVF